jgi:alpha-ketoglutarate-dependent 2,4-dichlorophenoxyacetate dioxygenase
MPRAIEQRDTLFKRISIRELHPTFGAEISGVDFSSPLPEDVFAEILSAITKVCYYNPYSWDCARCRY